MNSTTNSHPIPGVSRGNRQDKSLRSVTSLLKSAAKLVGLRGALAFCLPFGLYLLTLSPTIYNLDSAELTTAAATGGLMRATGYPLYLSIGHLWSKLPVGDVGFRLNLFSAFCGALTILLAERILRHWKVGPLAAWGALGLLATGTYFWGLSLIAEVYTLHTALMAGLILALLRWGEQPSPRRMLLVGLITGLSLSHHMAAVLLIPGSVFYLLTAAPRQALKPGSVGLGLLGLLVGLSFYLYLPLRYLAEPAFNYAGTFDSQLNFVGVNLASLEGIIWLVTGRAFTNQMFAYQGPALWREFVDFGRLLAQAFFVFGLTPGCLGLIMLFKRNWRQAGMLLIMFSLSVGFYVNYAVVDKDTMFLPAFLIWGLWAGYGYQVFFDWLSENLDEGQIQRRTRDLVNAAVVGLVLMALAWNWNITDLSADRSTREQGEKILALAKPGALVFGWWDTVPVIQYLQLVEGQRPDVTVVNRFLISNDDMRMAIVEHASVQPVYIDSPPLDLPAVVIPKRQGPVYELVTQKPNVGGKK
jgi:hypothetical protein